MAHEDQFGAGQEQQYLHCQPFLSKHNYGFTLAKTGRVGLMTAEARMVFNFLIPQPYDINMDARFNCSRIRNLVVRGQCVQFLRIARRFQEMIRRSNEYLKHKLDTIHDVLVDLPVTRSRRKRGFLTDVLGKVTGLATKDEVYKLVNILRGVESGVQKAAEAWKVGTSHFVSSYKIINNQIDNINTLLQLQRSSIAAIYKDIKTRFMAEAKFKLLNERTINDLYRLTLEISEIDLLFVAVQQLVNGQLPQFLIPHQDLQRGVDHFKEFLQTNYPELQLNREDLYYYYKHVKFNVVQVRNSIIMILHVPLHHTDLNCELDNYRLYKTPLAVPGSTVDFAMLSSDFYAIGYNRDADYYITFENVQDTLLICCHPSSTICIFFITNH